MTIKKKDNELNRINIQLFANPSNQQIIQKGRTMAGGQTDGMLNPEQSEKFMNMVFDDSSFLSKMSHEMRQSTKGTIEKLGVGRRLLRAKQEGESVGEENYVEPVLTSVPYSTVDMVLGAEVTEKFMRENIEKEGFEDKFMGMIASQVRIDLLDLYFSGDKDDVSGDAAFLTIMDGLNKQLETGSHIVDAGTINTGAFSDDIFTQALKALPSKYFDRKKYKWICNSNTYLTWIEYLKQKQTTAGDMAILSGDRFNPLGIPFEEVPNFPDGKIILADPANLTAVTTYDLKLRKTTEGKSAVMKDTRFYAIHLDSDIIIKEKEAIVVVDNVPLSV